MNIQKILDALEQTDQLGATIQDGCLLGQLFRVHKSKDEIYEQLQHDSYVDMFNGLLITEYGIKSNEQATEMTRFNDGNLDESPKARHIRVTEQWKNQLEAEACISSSQVEADSRVYEDVSTVQSHSLDNAKSCV